MDYLIKPPGLDHHFRQVTIKPFYLVVRSFETRWESLGQSLLWQLSNPHQAWSFDNVQVVIIKLFSSGSGESAGRDSSPESTEVVKPFRSAIILPLFKFSLSLPLLNLNYHVLLSLWDGDLASHVLMFLPLRFQCRKLAEALLFLSVSLMISFRWIFNLFWPLERWFHPWYFLISGWGTKLSLPPAGLSQIRIYEFRKAEIF